MKNRPTKNRDSLRAPAIALHGKILETSGVQKLNGNASSFDVKDIAEKGLGIYLNFCPRIGDILKVEFSTPLKATIDCKVVWIITPDTDNGEYRWRCGLSSTSTEIAELYLFFKKEMEYNAS